MQYVISDTHFDHRNIIDHCNRPFESVEEMNETLVENWNRTVAPTDRVLFLGDLTVKDDFTTFANRIEGLNGTIEFVLGDHDDAVMPSLESVTIHERYRFTYREIPYLCVHDPDDAPGNWDGWVLHGHHHNNWPDRFPFVNPERRSVNVSVECVGYTPVDIPTIVSCLTAFERLETLADHETT